MLNTLPKKISRAQSEFLYQIELIKHAKKLPTLTPKEQLIADALHRDGVYVTSLEDLGLASTPQLLDAAKSQVRNLEAEFSVDYSSENYAGTVENPIYPQTLTLTYQSEFATWGREQRLLNIIENYIALPVAFQGVQLQRDFANEKSVFTELWHSDAEDRRMIKVIVYLNDITEEEGPFQCIPKSKVSPSLTRQIQSKITKATELGINDTEMDQLIPRSEWKSCTGSAGTVVFVDPKAVFHHGKTRLRERAALFFVYTSVNPLNPDFCAVYNDNSFIKAEFARPC
jgi:hypothetical protein